MRIIYHILTLVILNNFSASSQNEKVVVITANCAIHPACADYIHTGIEKAIEENAECLIIKLNT
ncbi:MAG: hypothetical protein KJO12_01385, partial [Ignavibacteria bacterium]|nr:hypothetical protein [Ignavibacteria bacterium]